MAIQRSFVLNCACGKEFEAKLFDTLNVSEKKELKSQLIGGEINLVECQHCHKKTYIEKNLLYQDMDSRVWIQMLPQTERSHWPNLEADYASEVKKNQFIKKLQFRLAFGREELVEKIRIFDAGLEDRVIELLKLKILHEDEKLRDASDIKIIFTRYLAHEQEIHFGATSTEKGISQTIVVSTEHYEEMLENKEHLSSEVETQKICSGIYVNLSKIRVLH